MKAPAYVMTILIAVLAMTASAYGELVSDSFSVVAQKAEYAPVPAMGSEQFGFNRLWWVITRVTSDKNAIDEVLVQGRNLNDKPVRLDAKIWNPSQDRIWLEEPKAFLLIDQEGREFSKVTRSKVHDDFRLEFNKKIRPGETIEGAALFETEEDSTEFTLFLDGWASTDDILIELTKPSEDDGTFGVGSCTVNPRSLLLYGENQGNEVGLKSLRTVNWGENGRITSAVVFAKKGDPSSWRSREVILEVGRRHIDAGGKSRLEVPVWYAFDPSGDCFTGDLIDHTPLSVTSFDEEQLVSVWLRSDRGADVRVQDVFDLADFAR